jgi:hypothetical protein
MTDDLKTTFHIPAAALPVGQQESPAVEVAIKEAFKATADLAINRQDTLLGKLDTLIDAVRAGQNPVPVLQVIELWSGDVIATNINPSFPNDGSYLLHSITTWTRSTATGTFSCSLSGALAQRVPLEWQLIAGNVQVLSPLDWPISPQQSLQITISGGVGSVIIVLQWRRYAGG